MKVALTQNTAIVSGVPVYVGQLARGLRQRGEDVWIVTPDGEMVEQYRADGLEVVVRAPRMDFDWDYISWLRDWLHAQKIEVLHTNMLKTTVNGLIAGRLANTPVRVAHIHGTLVDWEVSGIKKVFNILANSVVTNVCATDVVALTTSIGEQLVRQEHIYQNKIRVLPNGIDLSQTQRIDRTYWQKKLGLDSDVPIIGSFSRLTVEKSVKTLIMAAPTMVRQIPRLQIVIAGEGNQQTDLESLSRQLHVEEFIHFVGFIPNTDKYSALSSLDAYVFPSRREGFGLTILEAMSVHTPVVSSDLPVLRDILDDGKTGLLFHVEDSQDLARQVLALLHMPREQRAAMVDRAYGMLEQRYTIDCFVERYIDLYRQALTRA